MLLGCERGQIATKRLAARTAALVVGTALLVSGCASGGQQADSGDGMAVAAAQQIESKGFPLCTWLAQAIAESDEPLSVMVETTYTLTDPIQSAALVVDPSGTENYQVGSDSSSQASCDVTGYATDPDYGDEISARITVSMQTTPDGFTAPDPDMGVEYNSRVILDESVLLDPLLRLDVSEFFGNGITDYAPFLQAMADYWDSGTWMQSAEDEASESSEATAALDWSNVVEICNRLDTGTLATMFALDSPEALDLEAEGYTRESTPGALKCTFDSGTNANRVEVVFERWNSAGEVSGYISNIAASACAQVGNLAFYQSGGSCDTSTNMDAYGYVDTVEVDIKSYFWRDYVSDEATYRGYVADLFTSAEGVVLELAGATP